MISLTSPVETRAHGWPAGAKLGALCAATLLLFGVEDLVWQIAFCAGMLLLYALPGRAFLKGGLGRLRMLWPFVALILLWHVLTSDAEAGLVIVLRMVTAVGLANLVTMTTKLSDMMAVVVRFTPVLAAKGQMLSLAWRARSRRRAGWRIVMPFTVLAIDDAEHVAEALRARGGL